MLVGGFGLSGGGVLSAAKKCVQGRREDVWNEEQEQIEKDPAVCGKHQERGTKEGPEPSGTFEVGDRMPNVWAAAPWG